MNLVDCPCGNSNVKFFSSWGETYYACVSCGHKAIGREYLSQAADSWNENALLRIRIKREKEGKTI